MAAKKKKSKKKTAKKGNKRPSMGTGIAEKGAKTIEESNRQRESMQDKIRREGGFPPAKRNTGYRKQ